MGSAQQVPCHLERRAKVAEGRRTAGRELGHAAVVHHCCGRPALLEEEIGIGRLRAPVVGLGIDGAAVGRLGFREAPQARVALGEANVGIGVCGTPGHHATIDSGGLLVASTDEIQTRESDLDLAQ